MAGICTDKVHFNLLYNIITNLPEKLLKELDEQKYRHSKYRLKINIIGTI